MKFLLDQDVPAEIGRVLVRAGHEVICERDVMTVSAADHVLYNGGRIRARIKSS